MASEISPNSVLLIMPVDHYVRDVETFRQVVTAGMIAATQGRFVLFGMRPTEPATGYGYIRVRADLPTAPGVYVPQRFVEKP
jgi:mannose-1-phosphate guanylyltransferase/mannose-1-phosphate guanylyltransferase/mannose-6-phosphate isomerase